MYKYIPYPMQAALGPLSLLILMVGSLGVRTAAGAEGALLWQDQFDGAAEFSLEKSLDRANAVAVQGERVFTAGFVDNMHSSRDFTVRAYDAGTGELLWQDQFDGTAGGFDEAKAIAVQGEQVFAVGTVTNLGSFADFTVRAYAAGTGELLWQDQLDGTAGGFDEARAIVVQGEQVFTAGTVTNFDSGSDFTVRAYNAGTGKLLWQNQFDGTVEFSLDRVNFDRANALTVQGERVFAVGVVRDDGFAYEGSFTLRTYAAETGELLWQDQFAGTAGGFNEASAVAAQGQRVFAVGTIDGKFTVRAYDLEMGELLWQNLFAGVSGSVGGANALAVQGERVFAAGVIGKMTDDLDYKGNFTVGAYAAETGDLLWQDQLAGRAGGFDAVSAVTVQGDKVFAVGIIDRRFTVRTYAAETGELLWQDRFAGTARGGYASAVTVQEERVFAAGEVDNADSGKDFTVRAYQLR